MTVTYWGSYWGLTPTAAHIHTAVSPTAAGGVLITLSASGGTIAKATSSLTSSQMNDLIGGLLYLNIHTTAYAGGEIRGQIHMSNFQLGAGYYSFCSNGAGISNSLSTGGCVKLNADYTFSFYYNEFSSTNCGGSVTLGERQTGVTLDYGANPAWSGVDNVDLVASTNVVKVTDAGSAAVLNALCPCDNTSLSYMANVAVSCMVSNTKVEVCPSSSAPTFQLVSFSGTTLKFYNQSSTAKVGWGPNNVPTQTFTFSAAATLQCVDGTITSTTTSSSTGSSSASVIQPVMTLVFLLICIALIL